MNPSETIDITPRLPGRPSLVETRVIDQEALTSYYKEVHSIRKTARHFQISPTTVASYLRGTPKKKGRNPQPKSWKAVCRSKVHQWFLEHAAERLPPDTHRISTMSGIPPTIINTYLNRRRNAVLDYLRTLPAPNTAIILFTDLDGFKVPSNLIADYAILVDKYTCDITLSCVLSTGGMRTILVPFHIYVDALTGKSDLLPIIGSVRPT